MTEPCSCIVAGWCERHQRSKSESKHSLCQRREDYRALWDSQVEVTYCTWTKKENAWFCVGSDGSNGCGRRWSGNAPPTDKPCPAKKDAATQAAIKARAGGKTGCCGGGRKVVSLAPPPMPSLFRRMLNFTSTMGEAASDVLHGKPALLSTGDVAIREQVCSKCQYRDANDFCRGCGCYLPLARKMVAKNCPLGLWPGDHLDWTPSVTSEWLAKIGVVVPYLRDEHGQTRPYTLDCLDDCAREPIQLIQIEGFAGWLDACNRGIEQALKQGCDFVVLLNDDTRLSKGFFSGLLLAYMQTGADVVTACYNVGYGPQRPKLPYMPLAEHYRPKLEHRQMGIVDGTCVMFTRPLIEALGTPLLDAEHFGKFGWGAVSDVCIRAKRASMNVYMTEASYAYHDQSKTAKQVIGMGYMADAKKELHEGMLAKYGQHYGQIQEAKVLSPDGKDITKRNLIYHCYPGQNDEWMWNLEQLIPRLPIFNGRRVMTIVTGEGLHKPEEVMHELRGHDFEYLIRPNDKVLYDSVGLLDMLSVVQSTEPNEGTFFAHSKGGSIGSKRRGWAEEMYHQCLDNPEALKALATHAAVGTCLFVGRHPLTTLFQKGWHFAGSFVWLNHGQLFTKNWREFTPDNRYFCEIYPSLFFDMSEVANVGKTWAEKRWA